MTFYQLSRIFNTEWIWYMLAFLSNIHALVLLKWSSVMVIFLLYKGLISKRKIYEHVYYTINYRGCGYVCGMFETQRWIQVYKLFVKKLRRSNKQYPTTHISHTNRGTNKHEITHRAIGWDGLFCDIWSVSAECPYNSHQLLLQLVISPLFYSM